MDHTNRERVDNSSEYDESLRCCEKTFTTSSALHQHRTDSPRHATDDKPLPQATNQRSRRDSVLKCSCGKPFKAQIDMDQHQRDSPKHREPTQSRSRTSTPAWRTITFVPEGHSILDPGRDARPNKKNATPFAKRMGTQIGKSEAGQKQRQSEWFDPASRGTGLYSGAGNWYPDVGDNHGLCDKECGWCGHCADEAGI